MEENVSEKIVGTCENIIFRNEENGYTVCDINTGGNCVTAVGIMPFINEGETVSVYGNWTFHFSFGKQFRVERFEKHLPTSKEMILSYLSSGSVRGIGPVIANRIVDTYGEDSLVVIENHPEWLSDIRGITPKRALEIGEEYRRLSGLWNLSMVFGEFFGPALAMKIYKRYGPASVDIIKNNPYVLCDEVSGIGFEKADSIAKKYGVDENSPARLEAGIKYIMNIELNRNEKCYVPVEYLIESSAGILCSDEKRISNTVNQMVFGGSLVAVKFGGKTVIYLDYVYRAEKYCAEKLIAIAESAINIPSDETEKYIKNVEEELDITFANLQKEAIKKALVNGLLVVTGGPGTGKTTVIRAILELFDSLGIKAMLAAPTGRAAKRMTHATGREAKTIHRLLEPEFDSDGNMYFCKCEEDPLKTDAVIIDESSMTDILLMSSLLKAIKPGTKVIFIGDGDQLPPVGAGSPFRDIISSGIFECVKLNEIFRQTNGSLIVTNAHKINNGIKPDLYQKNSDFFFMKRQNAQDVVKLCIELCKERLPNAYGYDSLSDIQIISPSRKGETGTVNLNKCLQESLNPAENAKNEKHYGGVIFRTGDKVMQIKNNYDISWKDNFGNSGNGVYNGDIGIICEISAEEEFFRVRFEDKLVRYEFAQFDEIEHAFAITVHKSQGSEYPCVIMPVFDSPTGLLTRNMLYTAVTRAQNMVILIGKESVIEQMIENNRHMKSYTGLARMLKSAKKDK